MHKLLAAAALVGALMIPTTTTTARVFGLPCESGSIGAQECGAGYTDDLIMCDIENPGGGGAWAGCVSTANWRYDRCMTTSC